MFTRPIGPTWPSQACCVRVDEMEKLAEPEISSLGSGKVGTRKVRDGGWSSSTWEGVGGGGCGQMTKHDIVDRGVYELGRVEACAVGAATIWLSSSHKNTHTSTA